MKNKALQYFSDQYLESCKKLTPEQILDFQENFRQLHSESVQVKSKLISIKIPENLLYVFKTKAKLKNVPYQSMIKILMKEWLRN